MARKTACLLCALALAISAGIAPAAAQDAGLAAIPSPTRSASPAPTSALGSVTAAAGEDDQIPGVYRNWYYNTALGFLPFADSVDASTDVWDVYPVYLETGEVYTFTLNSAGNVALYLFAPSATAVSTAPGAYHSSAGGAGPERKLTGTATIQGVWFVAVHATSGASAYTLKGDLRAPNDNIPGAGIGPSPLGGSLDSFSDWDDVYRVWLNEGDTLSARLTLGTSDVGFDPRLLVYGPSATNVWTNDEVALAPQLTFPKTATYTATKSGNHYLDVYQSQHATARVTGSYSVTWSVSRPVYRFYNYSLGTHFYTASVAEKASVIATLSRIYLYEGPAYGVNPYTNASPLYRFYKPSTGTHFYTASEAEKSSVQARLSHIYRYEGPAYNVSLTPGAGRIAAWRFYNVRNGTHFYTASEAERNTVINTLSHIYRYEGPAFFIGQ